MWSLSFISEEDFTNHVKATIEKYGEKLEFVHNRDNFDEESKPLLDFILRYAEIMKYSNMPNENNGNVVLGGHSGSGSVAYFNDLVHLSIGDEIILEYCDKKYIYVVSNIYNDYKDGRISIKRNINDTTVTLFTCNLLNKNHYLVIIGTLKSIA